VSRIEQKTGKRPSELTSKGINRLRKYIEATKTKTSTFTLEIPEDAAVYKGELGRGNFSRVFYTRDLNGNIFAAKIVTGEADCKASEYEKIIMKALQGVKHISQRIEGCNRDGINGEYIITILELYSFGSGQELMQALRTIKDPDLKARLAIFFAEQIIAGACNAENENSDHAIYHCDLKPENLLLTDELEVVLSDWGTSHRTPRDNTQVPNSLKRNDAGTFYNMSPWRIDVMRHEAKTYPADKQAAWEVGCTILEIFLGYHPLGLSVSSCADRNSWSHGQFKAQVDAIRIPDDDAGRTLMQVIKSLLNVDEQISLADAQTQIRGIASMYPASADQIHECRSVISQVLDDPSIGKHSDIMPTKADYSSTNGERRHCGSHTETHPVRDTHTHTQSYPLTLRETYTVRET